MATETGRLPSKFRKDRFEGRRDRTDRRNKAFETSDSPENKETTGKTTVTSVGISVRSTARSAIRTEVGKNEVGKSELELVTSKISRLNTNDERDGQEEPAARHDDSHDEADLEKKHIERKERGAGATTSKKRQQRKNLREKRRSTGVVIMPSMEGDTGSGATDDGEKVKENTYINEAMSTSESQGRGKSRGRSDELDKVDRETLIQQLEAYQQAIQEWRDEFEKSQKEIDSLRNENQRLRDENSSLLKVVSQLSSSSRK